MADTTPGTPFAAATTASTDAGFVSTAAGADEPAGNALASVSEPSTASGFTRNCSFWLSPTETPIEPSAITTSTRVAPMPTTFGRRCTSSPMRPQNRPSRGWSPTRGTKGQNSPRPNTTIAAGSTNSPNAAATTTPTADEKPMPRRLSCWASSSVSSARVTVAAEARIASDVRRSAICMPWKRESSWRSRSR